jgi:hypothetical protein
MEQRVGLGIRGCWPSGENWPKEGLGIFKSFSISGLDYKLNSNSNPNLNEFYSKLKPKAHDNTK